MTGILPTSHGARGGRIARLALAVALLLVTGCARPADHGLTCARNLRAIGQCVETWAREHGGTPPARLTDALAACGMNEVPSCPLAGGDTYSAGYKVEGRGFLIRCSSDHAGPAGGKGANIVIDRGFPLYDSRVGVALSEDDYRERLRMAEPPAPTSSGVPAAASSASPAAARSALPTAVSPR